MNIVPTSTQLIVLLVVTGIVILVFLAAWWDMGRDK